MFSARDKLMAILFSVLCVGLAIFWRPISSSAESVGRCRLVPGDRDWPNDADWSRFNATVGGKLLKNTPIGSPCYSNQDFAPFDAAKCESLQQAWNLPETHTESSSSIMAPFFANNSCNPFTGPQGSCVIGAYNQHAVRVRDAEDIKKTLLYAAKRNIRLTIRNSAHDYYGKSSGRGAISIWTKDLTSLAVVDFNKNNYRGKAIKLGAGVAAGVVSTFAKSKGLIVLGGSCPTVGTAGGYIQGAGTSLVSSQFGLAADNVLEYEVVTAKGDRITVSPTSNRELYWALSGGGGGTYAVVVSATVKAFADKKTASATLTFSSEGIDKDAYYGIVKVFLSNLDKYTDAGAGSTFILQGTGFSLAPMLGFGLSKNKIDELIKPTIDALTKKNVSYTYNSADYATLSEAYDATNPFTPVNFAQLGGRIIPKTVTADKLIKAFRTVNDAGSLISGYSLDVSRQPHAPNSVHPSWRSASMSVVTGTFFDEKNPQLNIDNQGLMTDTLIPALDRATAPATPASYLNEADFRDPDWQRTFYGDNYAALNKVKKKFDPEDLFYARTAVGSTAWAERRDGRLCRS